MSDQEQHDFFSNELEEQMGETETCEESYRRHKDYVTQRRTELEAAERRLAAWSSYPSDWRYSQAMDVVTNARSVLSNAERDLAESKGIYKESKMEVERLKKELEKVSARLSSRQG